MKPFYKKFGLPGGGRALTLLILGLWLFTGVSSSGCAHRPAAHASGSGPLTSAIEFYRGPLNHLNAVRTGSCPMHPGCSEYSRQAIDRYGPVLGWIMACDRLMRCGRDELDRAVPVLVDGQRRYRDPVSRNAGWWQDPEPFDPLESSGSWEILTD